MVQCCVPTCDNTSELNTNLSFHRFPKDKAQSRLWIAALHLHGWNPRVYSRVCIQHFNRDDMRICEERMRLVVGAVPTLKPKQIYETSPLYQKLKSPKQLLKKKKKNKRDPSDAAPVMLRKLNNRSIKENKTPKKIRKSEDEKMGLKKSKAK